MTIFAPNLTTDTPPAPDGRTRVLVWLFIGAVFLAYATMGYWERVNQ